MGPAGADHRHFHDPHIVSGDSGGTCRLPAFAEATDLQTEAIQMIPAVKFPHKQLNGLGGRRHQMTDFDVMITEHARHNSHKGFAVHADEGFKSLRHINLPVFMSCMKTALLR